ncbi:MAG: flagellar export chaperone FliS [Deltaproteobacteria bacterium]|nr:flagellar export chaperone FliS [Deltaproteobacteria bacterium]
MNRQLQAYRRTTTEADTPARRLDQVLERAIHECKSAAERIDARDPAGKGNSINRVVEIVAELEAALDFDLAPDLCERLMSLYIYMQNRLAYANIKLDSAAVREVAGLLSNLRTAFAEAAATNPNT